MSPLDNRDFQWIGKQEVDLRQTIKGVTGFTTRLKKTSDQLSNQYFQNKPRNYRTEIQSMFLQTVSRYITDLKRGDKVQFNLKSV